jgi:putative acetyltransferase
MRTVRREQPADVDAIRALHALSFPTMREAELVDGLRAAGRLRASLVAVTDGEVVAHVAFSPVTLTGASGGVGLGPLAVRPDCRRQGVAEQVVRRGLELCVDAGAGFVVVLGDPRYYSRFGFQPAHRWKLRDEYRGDDAFQAIELVSGAIPAAGGLVQYAPEFAALDEGRPLRQ